MPGNALFSAAISGWLWVTYCSLISPRRWQKAAVKRRPTSERGEKNRFCSQAARTEIWPAADKVPADQLRKGDIVLVELAILSPAMVKSLKAAHRSMKRHHRGIGSGDP